MIKNASTETLLSLCTVVELKSFLRARKLPVSGRKSVLIERLVNNGFKVRRREYRYMLFEFTDLGAGIVRQYYSDRCLAFLRAVYALIDGDYSGAISALRGFDNKWGFSHSSGKKHTIFAHFDVPFGQFEFIAKYPMRELQNTENFKSTFRSYLIASLMCGVHTPYGAELVEELCHEQIRCPRIVDYYARSMTLGELMENKDMLSAMRENVASDNSYVLEYYVSRVMYLSRRSCK